MFIEQRVGGCEQNKGHTEMNWTVPLPCHLFHMDSHSSEEKN